MSFSWEGIGTLSCTALPQIGSADGNSTQQGAGQRPLAGHQCSQTFLLFNRELMVVVGGPHRAGQLVSKKQDPRAEESSG